MPAPYLLDTTVLLHWTRNSPQAQAIDAKFQLSSSAMRPLVCEVSLGEMLAFSLSRNWGAQKVRRLGELEDRNPYSCRSVFIGSSRAARFAGIHAAHRHATTITS